MPLNPAAERALDAAMGRETTELLRRKGPPQGSSLEDALDMAMAASGGPAPPSPGFLGEIPRAAGYQDYGEYFHKLFGQPGSEAPAGERISEASRAGLSAFGLPGFMTEAGSKVLTGKTLAEHAGTGAAAVQRGLGRPPVPLHQARLEAARDWRTFISHTPGAPHTDEERATFVTDRIRQLTDPEGHARETGAMIEPFVNPAYYLTPVGLARRAWRGVVGAPGAAPGPQPAPPRLALPAPPLRPLLPPGPSGPFTAPGGFGPVPGPQGVPPPLALPPAPIVLRRPTSPIMEQIEARMRMPSKRPAEPSAPLEVKGAPLEGEVLDQFGRPIPPGEIPKPTMTERERLRTLYKGRIGTAGPTEAERLEERMRDVVTEGGGAFKGVQSIKGKPLYAAFNEPKYGSTLYLPIDEATPAAVRRKIADKQAAFEAAAKPATKPEVPTAVPSPIERPIEPPVSPKPLPAVTEAVTGKVTPPVPSGGITWNERPGGLTRLSAFQSGDKRFFVEQKDPDRWVIYDRRAKNEKATFPTFHDARQWANARVQPQVAPSSPAKAPSPPAAAPTPPPPSAQSSLLAPRYATGTLPKGGSFEEVLEAERRIHPGLDRGRFTGEVRPPAPEGGVPDWADDSWYETKTGHWLKTKATADASSGRLRQIEFRLRQADLDPELRRTLEEERARLTGTKATFFEKTKLGPQAMIAGTEARAIPTSKLTAKGPQASAEGTLFEKPSTAVQPSLEIPPAPAPRGQHYGKTVSPGTANLTDPEEVRMLIRDSGGINPARSTGLDVAAVPKEFLKPTGRDWDELVQEIADAQGKRPKEVERALNRTFSRYSTMRQELRAEGLLTEIRAAEPPPGVGVSLDEWRNMAPADRRASIEWYRDVFTDESGTLNVGKMIDAWKKSMTRLRNKLPMEMSVLRAVPDSPVISDVERWNVGLANGIARVAETPWWKGIKRSNPEALKDLDNALARDWLTQIPAPIRVRMRDPKVTLGQQEVLLIRQARDNSIARLATPEVRAALAHRDQRLIQENQARQYFGAQPIPEELGPYFPRRVDTEAREAVQLGGGQLGVGRGLQTTVRGHQQERIFETYRQGEAAGITYEDPRNAFIYREWEGLKLRATHRLFQDLEAKGVLFRDPHAALAASPTGKPYRVERAPGGNWWARSEQEARFLEQNLTESGMGPWRAFVHHANALFRNPNLIIPMPHIVKNMWAKALLARGPATLYTMGRDAVEYFRNTNPALVSEFKQAMPFSSAGNTAGELLGNELVRTGGAAAVRLATRTLGLLNKPSSKVIFEWADPAMRYSLYKYYRGQGLTPNHAANHAWIDLIRYGTRSDRVDFWKAVPMNFFVPWRYGTLVSLIKQVKNHPIRTALLVAGVDYLREIRYREHGKWTHLPWDYTENPLAIAVQNIKDPTKPGWQKGAELGGIVGTTLLAGPGGAFGVGQLVDVLNDIRGRGDWERAKNMFWGISQLYNLPQEWKAFQETGDTKYLADMVGTAMLGEHTALTYQPRRLMRDLPEWLPGMKKSPLVEAAERMQQRRKELGERRQQRREERPPPTIEDRLKASGYLK